jgi:uncharacterized membrane protein YbhN (UPF0104 family)
MAATSNAMLARRQRRRSTRAGSLRPAARRATASMASAAPTPGGVGAVEAALITGLTATGVPDELAVPAVLVYRVATFWLPVLPGWLAFTLLTRRGVI